MSALADCSATRYLYTRVVTSTRANIKEGLSAPPSFPLAFRVLSLLLLGLLLLFLFSFHYFSFFYSCCYVPEFHQKSLARVFLPPMRMSLGLTSQFHSLLSKTAAINSNQSSVQNELPFLHSTKYKFWDKTLCLSSSILLVFYVDFRPNLLLLKWPFRSENSYPTTSST